MAVRDAEQIELPETHSRTVQARIPIPKRRAREVRQGCARACPPRTAPRNGILVEELSIRKGRATKESESPCCPIEARAADSPSRQLFE